MEFDRKRSTGEESLMETGSKVAHDDFDSSLVEMDGFLPEHVMVRRPSPVSKEVFVQILFNSTPEVC